MKTSVEVKDREEGNLIRAGLDDPAVRAFVKVVAALNALPNDRARARVLRWMDDRVEQEREEMHAAAHVEPEPVNHQPHDERQTP